MEAAVYTPALEYSVRDVDTGNVAIFHGHQVGAFVVRNCAPFEKRKPRGVVETCLDPWGVEHWALGVGCISLVHFEPALFVAGQLDAARGGAEIADLRALFAFLTPLKQWMDAQAFAARFSAPLLSIEQFKARLQGASA